MNFNLASKGFGIFLGSLFFALLIVLSILSGHRIQNVETLNWDVVLMLSPWGLINNLLLHSDHYLRPYYFQLNSRSESLLNPAVAICLVCLWVTVFLILKRTFRKD